MLEKLRESILYEQYQNFGYAIYTLPREASIDPVVAPIIRRPQVGSPADANRASATRLPPAVSTAIFQDLGFVCFRRSARR